MIMNQVAIAIRHELRVGLQVVNGVICSLRLVRLERIKRANSPLPTASIYLGISNPIQSETNGRIHHPTSRSGMHVRGVAMEKTIHCFGGRTTPVTRLEVGYLVSR